MPSESLADPTFSLVLCSLAANPSVRTILNALTANSAGEYKSTIATHLRKEPILSVPTLTWPTAKIAAVTMKPQLVAIAALPAVVI